VLWRNKILADGDVHSSALIDPETNAVYSACGCENDGRLLALDPTPADMTDGPGEALWPAAIVTPRILYHSPAQENRRTSPRYRRVYIGSLDGVLHAFSPDDANGQWVKHWSFLPLANGTNTKSSPIIGDDGTIYMGSYLGLSAITDNGSSAENKWPPFLTNERVDATPALSQDGATVYFGISTNPYRFYAVRTATGSEKWHYPRADLGQQRLESFIKVPAVVGLDGTIYVAARRTVYAFRDDGDRATMLWSYRTVGVVLGLSLGTNALFVTANDQKLYKLEDDRP
jgi:outer membrane protein assembly factor BamB